MKFSNVYNKTILYWNNRIDVSDHTPYTKERGLTCHSLSDAYEDASKKCRNEWCRLMCWVIFSILHKMLKQDLDKKILTLNIPDDLDKSEIEGRFHDALKQHPSYRSMLDKYIQDL